ncbi:MAG: hypothetical protein R3322_15250 [Kiloniellales bacterium]|nr:hypothetical protein [Kiloniellales bacterium]
MWRERPRLFDHTVNQRLAGLYVLYGALAVAVLAFAPPVRSAAFIAAGAAVLVACVVLARWVARCPACGLDCRYYPVAPAGSTRIRFRNINWFAPERCPHCNADLLGDS